MLTRETPITIRTHVPDSADFGTTEETTWGAFEDANDPATVADARAQIEVDNYAELGGGAAPIVWVFA